MSTENRDLFNFLEKSLADVYVPELPDRSLEQHLEMAANPLVGAQMIQDHIETQPLDMHEELLNLYVPLLNFRFMREYANRPTQIRINEQFDMYDVSVVETMCDALIELEDKGSVQIGGKMDYFDLYYYTNQETGVRRPILSLCMHSGTFKRENNDDGIPVGIKGLSVVPVSAIAEYTIKENV